MRSLPPARPERERSRACVYSSTPYTLSVDTDRSPLRTGATNARRSSPAARYRKLAYLIVSVLSGSESKLAVVITSAGFTDHCWRLVQVASHGVVDQVEISAGEVFVPFRGLRVPEMSVMRASGAREQPIALVGAIRRPAPAHVTSMEELRKRGAENRD